MGRTTARTLTACAAVILTVTLGAGPAPEALPTFVRFQEDGHGGGQMQAAFASYANADGAHVDLFSTVHIGDVSFFRALAKRLGTYDAVLYELVAPRGVPATEEGVNPQQQQIADDMHLENQGPHMSYERHTFVHADLDLEDIQKLETQAHGTFKGALGEGPGIKAAKDARDTARQRAVFADIANAKSAVKLERYRLMRRAYGRLLAFTACPAPGATYPAGMEVLVGSRNEKVMSVLSEQLAAGKTHIGILYGAAHMVDLEHRLLALGFHRTGVDWQTAWTVEPDGTPTTRPVKGTPIRPAAVGR